MAQFGFEQCINSVTREEIRLDMITESCIDHIFIKSDMINECRSAVIKHKIADHYIIACSIPSSSKVHRGPSDYMIYNIGKTNLNNKIINKLLKELDWKSVLKENENISAETLYKRVIKIFANIYEEAEERDENKKGHFKMATKGKIRNGLRMKLKWESKTKTKSSEKLKLTSQI